MQYDLIIIGMGPGGMSAGIYAKRNGLNVLVLEKNVPGGLVNITSDVGNYLGFNNISGPDLASKFFEHFNEVGVSFRSEEVTGIEDGELKKVITTSNTYETKKIIIATGRRARLLGLENEKELIGRGISHCALCDAHLYKDKVVAVVGSGNSALEESLHLANIAKKVYLLNRSSELKGEEVLKGKVLENEVIELMNNTYVTKINKEDNKLGKIEINDNQELDIDGLFVFIGYEPSVDFDNNILTKNDLGYIKVDENYETNIKGIYAIGDIIEKKYFQIILSVAEGAVASSSAFANIKIGK